MNLIKKIEIVVVCMLLITSGIVFVFENTKVKAEHEGGSNGGYDDENWWIYPEIQPGQIYAAPTFNWNKYWSVFKNHSLWSLEGWNPSTEQWEFCNDSLTVEVTEVGDNERKLNLIFDAPASVTTDYRLTLAIDYRVKQYVHKVDKYTYNLSFEVYNESFNVSYNFSDIASIPGIIITHGVKEINGHDYFWFRARKNDVPSDAHVELDPTYTVYAGANVRCGNPSQRKLVRQSNGTIWCTFDENYDVHVAWSDDEGVTWNDIEVYGIAANRYSSIAVDSNDVVHLVYQTQVYGADYQLVYSNSSDWTNRVRIRNEAKHHTYPAIAVDSNDNIHITYNKEEEGISNNYQVAYINSTDNGGSWGTEKILTNEPDAGDRAYYSSIAIDSNNVIHVVFLCTNHYLGKDDILHMSSSDYGDTWTGWEGDPVYQDPNKDQSLPVIAIDDNDKLHVIWYGINQHTTSQIGYAWNDSTGWNDNEWITWDPSKQHYYASISVNDNNYVHIGIDVDGTRLNHSVNDTVSWTMDTALPINYLFPNMISAHHPIINGLKTNRPNTGFAFIVQNPAYTNVTYHASSDLTWDNTAPTQSNQKIWNATTKIEKFLNATDVDLYPTSFNITINDANNDLMDITILSNESGSWTVVNLPWWDTDWSYYKTITIDNSYIYNSLEDFPILVVIPSSIGSKCDNGNSIRFLNLDNSTEYYYEIELWNNTGNSFVWVNVPSLTNSSNKFLMYYNNSGASDNQHATDVWDSNYVLVCHMSDTPTGTIYDSTSNNNDLTSSGGMTNEDLIDGKIGKAIDFDGVNDYISAADHASLRPASAVTLMSWIKTPSGEFKRWTIGKMERDKWGNYDSASYSIRYDTAGATNVDGGYAVIDGNDPNYVSASVTWLNDSWCFGGTTFDSSNIIRIYVNDSLENSEDHGDTLDYDNPQPLYIMGSHTGAGGGINEWQEGVVDEFRISNICRNDSWIGTSFHTMNNTTGFMTFGSEQSAPARCSSLSNGTYSFYNTSWIDTYNTKYWISFNVTDGTDWTNETYHYFTTSINTSVDDIIPYCIVSSPLNITSTGDSSLDNVTLWYRYSSNNSSWGGENWWNSSWTKRTHVNLSVSSDETEENHTVLLNVSYDTDMNNDFSDLRFVRYADNTTLLDYCVESQINGNWCSVWVEFRDNITTTDQPLAWMYYGNSDASSQSNGVNTFLFFDAFSGSTLDSNRWPTQSGSITVSNGRVHLDFPGTSYAYAQSNSLDYTGVLEFRSKYTYDSNIARFGSFIKTHYGGTYFGRGIHIWDGTNYTLNTNDPNVNHKYKIVKTSTNASWYFDDNYKFTRSISGNIGILTLGNSGEALRAGDVWFDYMFIRKYASSDPTYSIGGEQDSGSNWMVWSNSTNPDIISPWSWNFDFPNGKGYYEFYSIGKKSGQADESPPVSADARCCYRNQSKIKNVGSTNIKGYLLIQVQFWNETLGKWVVDNDTINETTPRTINVGELGLDTIFNGNVNTNDLTNGDGTYRVYAAFRDPEGNVLVCDAMKLEAWWEFEVDTS